MDACVALIRNYQHPKTIINWLKTMKMKKFLLFTSIMFISIVDSYCMDKQDLNSSGTTDLFLNEKVNAIGPRGNITMSIASNDMIDSLSLSGYPHLINAPDSLSGLKVYTYILNPMQFYYQNYRNGIYSREFFLDWAKKQKWVLDDTLTLTSKTVKNYYSIAVGFDSDHNPKYVVDANGNDDFSDDELTTLLKSVSVSLMAKNSKKVAVEYFDGVSIRQEYINFLPILSPWSKDSTIALGHSFPQFRYARISLEGRSFFVCSDVYSRYNSIFIIPDQPNFGSIDRDNEVKRNQLCKIGDLVYRFVSNTQNMDRVTLKREDNKNDINVVGLVLEKNPIYVSERIGMKAPEILGRNIQDGSILSLKSLKGKYVFLDFWATSCGPCIREFPIIRKAFDTFSSDQLVIFGVCEDNYRGKLSSFLKDKGVTWPTIVKSDSTTITNGYNISSWPTNFLIGPDGIILKTNIRGESLLAILEQLKIKKK